LTAVGKDIPHDSSIGHVTGRSVFLDDIAPARNELLVSCFGSPVAHGRIKSVDLSSAKAIPGIAALLTHKDIPGHNTFGMLQDEHLLAADVVEYVGDPIVLIAGETLEAIEAAKKAIYVDIEELPPVLSIDDALAAGNFIGPQRVIERGNVEAALAEAEHRLDGSLITGGQEHFYFESQVAIAHPGEHGQMTIQSSTQHPTEAQHVVAETLGVPFNHVVVTCKRMGGAFGGKETQASYPAAMAALAAAKTQRPCRFAFSKDDDMRFTGKRHPFQSRWSVGFDSLGRIAALSIDLYLNGGCSCDLSLPIMERAMLHCDNAYFIPNFRVTGRICKTNFPSNTAFRGFGVPQGIVNVENIVEEVARRLQIDALDVRQLNCYGSEERNQTPYGQIVENNTLPRLFSELRRSSDYDLRQHDIAAFNRSSRTHLRGLSMTAVKFGISFTNRSMNQANALVNIYTDGTVMVSTGGTEMGQGLNTRLRQIVADELGLSYDAVLVAPTSTDKNNNTSPTAASTGTDLNGAAAADACRRLRQRLTEFAASLFAEPSADPSSLPLIDSSPTNVRFQGGKVFDSRRPERRMTFKELVGRAHQERINLGERGFYATPGIGFDRETGRGTPFFYYTNGAAAAEVEIDRFTGELKVCRVDLLIDAGQCINPGIDRGQVTGGFIQGMGWVTTEELKYSDRGELLSHSPATYKIPNMGDLPEVFNVAFLDNPDNTVTQWRSKSVGEPPLPLAVCVWTAVKHALSWCDGDAASNLTLPATAETILFALQPTPEVCEAVRS
jgi:xanthine dehydrogenase large subunit